MLNDISRFRRLSRAVTSQTGALDTSFLGLGRPLGSARVLNAIGHGKTDLAELRDYLRLDSGLMSRLLRSLENEGLVETKPSEKDARKRTLHLTAEGQRIFEQYETLSDENALDVLDRYSQKERLLEAMDLIATVYGRDQITIEPADPEDPRVLQCVQSYVDELSRVFETTFDPVTSGDPESDSMRAPNGVFLLAMSDGLPIACGALSNKGNQTGEIKRVWISPAARGLGLAKRLMTDLEDRARALGMTRLVLDTNGRLTTALNLYRTTGWTEIDRYNDNPYAEHFFEKHLS